MRFGGDDFLASVFLMIVAGYKSNATDVLCQAKIPNGDLRHDCFPQLYDMCNFWCHPGFKKNRFIKHISCMDDGWEPDVLSLCIEKNNVPALVCPVTVIHGAVVGDCTRLPGVSCDYNCESGFVKPDPDASAFCARHGTWQVSQPCTADVNSISVSDNVWFVAGIASIPLFLILLFLYCARKKRSRYCSQEFDGQTPPRGMTTAEFSEVQSLNLGEATISQLPHDPLIISRYKQQISQDPAAPPSYKEAVFYQEETTPPPSYSEVVQCTK